MDDLIQKLIKKEEDARNTVTSSQEFKTQMKKQALHDAALELSLIQSEYDQKIENMKKDNIIRLKEAEKKLAAEFEILKTEASKKDFQQVTNSIVLHILGEDENVE